MIPAQGLPAAGSTQRSEGSRLPGYAAWSLALAGLVGGSVYAVVGLVVAIAGSWAWLSFVLAGLVGVASASVYARLAADAGEGGGAFTFLRDLGWPKVAGRVSWLLLIGYTLTVALAGYAFAQLLQPVLGLGSPGARVLAAAAALSATGVAIAGLGGTERLEIVGVWVKVAVLAAVATAGLARWAPPLVTELPGRPGGLPGAVVGASVGFVAVEGFQLLSHRFVGQRPPRQVLGVALPSAVAVAVAVFVAATFGTMSLVGARQVAQRGASVFAAAGGAAFGPVGHVVVPVLAAVATVSVLYATLTAVARLALRVAEDGELPAAVNGVNRSGVPHRAVLAVGAVSAVLAAVLPRAALIEAPSAVFLAIFGLVNLMAFVRGDRRVVAFVGAVGAAGGLAVLVGRTALTNPLLLGGLLGAGAATVGLSRLVERRTR